ncbi:MAG: hypothetical protein MRY21_06990 [Simkaniaceae bacterium]|nr:hypothetical protein [Simkaniaceae bacterium]
MRVNFNLYFTPSIIEPKEVEINVNSTVSEAFLKAFELLPPRVQASPCGSALLNRPHFSDLSGAPLLETSAIFPGTINVKFEGEPDVS